MRGQTKQKVKLFVLVLFVGDHHAAGGLVDDRCTLLRCMTQSIAFVVAFGCGLAH